MKFKKALAALLTSAMIMGMSVTAFAAPGATPTENDSLDVTSKILNVEDGATITAYQVIDAVYNDSGFVKYQWIAGDNKGQDVVFDVNGNIEGLTDAYITGLASNTTGMTSTTELEELPAGTWMLLVTGSDLGKVYNPMIISVYYNVSGSDGTLVTGGVDADDNWTLETSGAYVKSQETTIEKTVAATDDDTAEVGDIKTFTIKGKIPSYSANSKALYSITDTITNGLEYVISDGAEAIAPTVTIGGATVLEEKYTVVMGQDNKSFTIKFDADYIKGLAAAGTNRDLVITYQAKVTEDAITQVAENTAKVEYDQGSYDSTEYVYTVNFDGAAKKVGVDADANGLAGATFTLYKDATDTDSDGNITAEELASAATVVGTYVTKADDYDIEFKGLDASETYYLTETAAPTGYTINNTVYTITFTDVVMDEGNISYKVNINGNVVASVTAYNTPAEDSTFKIENTKLSSLPSTGGIGTTIFTIGGCAVMIAAASLFFVSRRKSESK